MAEAERGGAVGRTDGRTRRAPCPSPPRPPASRWAGVRGPEARERPEGRPDGGDGGLRLTHEEVRRLVRRRTRVLAYRNARRMDSEVTYGWIGGLEGRAEERWPLRPVAPMVGGRMRENPPLFVSFKLLNLNFLGAVPREERWTSFPSAFLFRTLEMRAVGERRVNGKRDKCAIAG